MLIRLEVASRRYRVGDSEVPAVREVSLCIERGEYAALMGPSGSGKSTLMHLLGCLERPSCGRYWFDGEPVEGRSDEELSDLRSRRIGFVFQSFFLLPELDVVENVEVPLVYQGATRSERRERAAAILGQVGLGSRLRHRPNELSGGERQRAAIARALVTAPDLLLADEPTGSLDSRTGDEILDLLEQRNAAGTTLVVVTHDAAKAGRARRLLQMRDGSLVGDTRERANPMPRRAAGDRLVPGAARA
jgi:putative ABC transport system ATP-binding protein